MIPVRVPADAQVHTVGEPRRLASDHPLFVEDCPVCDRVFGSEPIILVYIGTPIEKRKATGWTRGAAVVVHAECTGLGKD